MPRRSTDFIVRNPSELDVQFYSTYDAHFLWKKVTTLWIVCNRQDAFREFVRTNAFGADLIGETFYESLRAEIHFAEFHQFETFFALLLAPYQNLPAWLYLTTYTTAEIKNKVNLYLAGDISGVTNGMIGDAGDFITNSVYAGYVAYKDRDPGSWKTNTDNVNWYLGRLARKYIGAREYNAYKHGLRAIAGKHSVEIGVGDSPSNFLTMAASPDSLTYLELEEVTDDESAERFTDVRQVTKHFNPAQSVEHFKFMVKCLETIKQTRSARASGDLDPERVSIWPFFDLDRTAIPETDPFHMNLGV